MVVVVVVVVATMTVYLIVRQQSETCVLANNAGFCWKRRSAVKWAVIVATPDCGRRSAVGAEKGRNKATLKSRVRGYVLLWTMSETLSIIKTRCSPRLCLCTVPYRTVPYVPLSRQDLAKGKQQVGSRKAVQRGGGWMDKTKEMGN